MICLVDIDPSEDPCRWPHCARPMHTDCNVALHAARDPPRCPACRIDQNGCRPHTQCDHGRQPHE
eukprot:7671946-Lingulodinium_polyedra.AAC.1